LYLYGDSGALYQVLTNLIRNALDASQGQRSAVLISLDRVGEDLHLAVRDTGQGITAEHLPRIFDRGFTTKPPGKGSGIGLAVVKEITEAMFGGTVRVDSRVGEGTTFTLILPIPPQRNR
jgi:signal transduction histidine kinase